MDVADIGVDMKRSSVTDVEGATDGVLIGLYGERGECERSSSTAMRRGVYNLELRGVT